MVSTGTLDMVPNFLGIFLVCVERLFDGFVMQVRCVCSTLSGTTHTICNKLNIDITQRDGFHKKNCTDLLTFIVLYK
jgi:hypothetical protein